jgi:hypothetical protein
VNVLYADHHSDILFPFGYPHVPFLLHLVMKCMPYKTLFHGLSFYMLVVMNITLRGETTEVLDCVSSDNLVICVMRMELGIG